MNDIQTKKVKVINKETLIITVDISKVTNVGYYRCPNGIDVKPFGFHDSGQGLKYFWDIITRECEARYLWVANGYCAACLYVLKCCLAT